ncbi:MAG TPA: DUF3455 domain-containing protein [Acetobacteraceae bacterium]|jgi:hypothetical protein
MIELLRTGAAALVLLATITVAMQAAELPDTIAAKGEVVVTQLHAEGAQIYECKADASGQLTWQFREPVASLFLNGATVGRHYAGPTWESGGSTVVGKAVGRAPGAESKDIPWLKLEVSEQHGDGPLKHVKTVQRINTKGGNADGKCQKSGELHAEPYSADYVFLRTAS